MNTTESQDNLRADLQRERLAVARLLFLLEEEYIANGDSFCSMDTDVLFKRWYWSETTTSNQQVFANLRSVYKTYTTNDS